ncbi:hypothetical protein MRX96_006029 [Rhipicephalus microplus]
MLHSTPSGTELLLRSQNMTSSVHNLSQVEDYHQGAGNLRPVSVGRQQEHQEVLPKSRSTSQHLERRTGVPACFKLQPLRNRTAFDARPRRSTRASVASELCNHLIIAPDVQQSRCSTPHPSGTELLLRSQHWTSSVHHLSKSRITIKVPVGLLVLDMMPAALVALWPLPKRQVDLILPHPAMAWLMMNFSFDNINASKSAFLDGLSRRDLGFSAQAECPARLCTKEEQQDGHPTARRRLRRARQDLTGYSRARPPTHPLHPRPRRGSRHRQPILTRSVVKGEVVEFQLGYDRVLQARVHLPFRKRPHGG